MHIAQYPNPNFLVKPDPNRTRSQKALFVMAWFRWPPSITKGTYTSNWGLAQNGQKPGCAPENEPYLRNGKKFRVGNFWGGSPGRIVPSRPLEPCLSIFLTQNRCIIGSPIWGYQKGYSLPPQKRILAQKRPNLPQKWHFWPNIGIFGPFDSMPHQKQSHKVPRWCSVMLVQWYQNFCFLP